MVVALVLAGCDSPAPASGDAHVEMDAHVTQPDAMPGDDGPTTGTTILFDDFTGTAIDETQWTVFDRIGDQVNGEIDCVVPTNVSVAGGLLSGSSRLLHGLTTRCGRVG